MTQHAAVPSPVESVASPARGDRNEPPASRHHEVGRSHALPLIFWLLEQSRLGLLAVPLAVGASVTWGLGGGIWTFLLAATAVPLAGVALPLAWLVCRSHRHDAGAADTTPYLTFRDPKLSARWAGKKIPMEILYEAYMAERVDFKADVYDVLKRRNQLFRFCFTWGDVKFYFGKFLGQNVDHGVVADRGEIVPVYNRGNDFYRACLGESMTFTCGIFESPMDTLEEAQERKLATVCKSVQMKPGDRHLDLGCGWGPLIVHAAERHGVYSTGVTLAQEQADWALKHARAKGVAERVRVMVCDYREVPAERYDKITCLEMAEHVGIKNFQKMLLQVRSMLEDDGIFYLQIAGLRRAWHFEDLVWGLFMAKYIFPGADASCPLGFVVSQAERAGFEVHRVENCGVHYSATILRWYENWKSNRDAVVASYGERWYRKWLFFLAWSALISAQGTSAVYMITLAKNTKNDKDSVSPEEAQTVPYSRAARWIGSDVVGTQR